MHRGKGDGGEGEIATEKRGVGTVDTYLSDQSL